jgi:hypothetical protein
VTRHAVRGECDLLFRMFLGQFSLVVAAPAGIGLGHTGMAGGTVRISPIMGHREGVLEGGGFPCCGVMTGRTLVCKVYRRAFGGMAAYTIGGSGSCVVHDGTRPGYARIFMAVGAVARVVTCRAFAFVA